MIWLTACIVVGYCFFIVSCDWASKYAEDVLLIIGGVFLLEFFVSYAFWAFKAKEAL